MSNAVPFRLISELDKKAFSSNIVEALHVWVGEWFQTKPKLQIELLDDGDLTCIVHEKWFTLGESPDSWVAWKLDGVVTRDLLSMMFNAPMGSSAKITVLMQEILDECILGLVNGIFASSGIVHTALKKSATLLEPPRVNHGSGALLAELRGDFPHQRIAFGGEIVERMLKLDNNYPLQHPYAIATRESAIVNYKTRLEMIAGSAELTLRDLANLETGDVIRLDTLMGVPFRVRTVEGLPLAKAHLGTYQNSKAIQLIEEEKYAR